MLKLHVDHDKKMSIVSRNNADYYFFRCKITLSIFLCRNKSDFRYNFNKNKRASFVDLIIFIAKFRLKLKSFSNVTIIKYSHLH